MLKRGEERKQEKKSEAEISNTEITFLDTVVYKGKRFRDHSILDIKTHFKPTETFQYTHFSSSHPSGVKKGFVKGEALKLLRTNSSRTTFEENIYKFKSRLLARGYPKSLIETLLSDVKFTERESALRCKFSSENFPCKHLILQLSSLHVYTSSKIHDLPSCSSFRL